MGNRILLVEDNPHIMEITEGTGFRFTIPKQIPGKAKTI